ncbi:MAG: SPFH domain-containing protein [Acidobacteria bacterium]|nr:SPFH domain-containing protein [Acidobacteriota bacterium]
MIQEKVTRTVSGLPVLLFLLPLLVVCVLGIINAGMQLEARQGGGLQLALCIVVWFLDLLCLAGLFMVQPNQGVVLMLFGAYRGTEKHEGLRWANPFYTKKKISLRVRNFETSRLKVNDKDGNPIEIGAVVVWKVVDTAEAVFEVDNYEHYVSVQSEAALRNLATAYPYDSHEEAVMSLRGHTAAVATHLQAEIQDRLAKAGVLTVEARISILAYAPEIAADMLRRQQAAAIIAARAKIVEGAVTMVEMALEHLSKNNIVQLDEERKAAMVSNLMVVLCSDRPTQPVVNAGTLYH